MRKPTCTSWKTGAVAALCANLMVMQPALAGATPVVGVEDLLARESSTFAELVRPKSVSKRLASAKSAVKKINVQEKSAFTSLVQVDLNALQAMEVNPAFLKSDPIVMAAQGETRPIDTKITVIVQKGDKNRNVAAPKVAQLSLADLADDASLEMPASADVMVQPSWNSASAVALVGKIEKMEIPASLTDIMPKLAPYDMSANLSSSPISVDQASASKPASGLSLADSVEQTQNSVEQRQAATSQVKFSREQRAVGYTTVALQLIDDRSMPEAKLLYPAAGVTVRIVGTEFVGKSDSTGHVVIKDMPRRSHFLVAIGEGSPYYSPSVIDLATADQADSGVKRVKIARSAGLETLNKISSLTPNADYSSLCGRLVSHTGELQKDLSVSVSGSAEAVVYVNRFGFVDRSLKATSENGRFCVFNIEPGPSLVSIYDAAQRAESVAVTFFPGRHMEKDLIIDQQAYVDVKLATVSTAVEQLSRDANAAHRIQSVDYVELLPLGYGTALVQQDDGMLRSQRPVMTGDGRAYVLARASEFESTLHAVALSSEDSAPVGVTTLIPRGYLDDMSQYAQIAQDHNLGALMVEHGKLDGQGDGALHMRLVDFMGRDVGDRWYYSDNPISKTVFFNLAPGTYQLIIESSDKFWLGGDVVTIYSETLSVSNTGARLY